jgi:ribosomal protein S18 acetylase RimI-like enzyme
MSLPLKSCSIKYRNIQEQDISSVAELCSAVFDGGQGWREADENFDKVESIKGNREAINQRYHELVLKDSIMSHKEGNPHTMIVAVNENQIICGFLEVGFLHCPVPVTVEWAGGLANQVTDIPYLGSVLVHKDYRRRGIGSGLVRIGEMICRGWKEGSLWLNVDSDNIVAIAMYKHMGFESRVDERNFSSSAALLDCQTKPLNQVPRIYMSKSMLL